MIPTIGLVRFHQLFFLADGERQEKGKINTGKGALFLVDKPAPGVWKIKCPSCSLESYITSNSISLENIDFDYSFLIDVKIEGKARAISSSYPIKGMYKYM